MLLKKVKNFQAVNFFIKIYEILLKRTQNQIKKIITFYNPLVGTPLLPFNQHIFKNTFLKKNIFNNKIRLTATFVFNYH